MDENFFQQVMRDCQEAISNTLRKSKKLLTETINEKVYSPKTPKEYQRTYTFADAWQLGDKIRSVNKVSQSLDYDYTIMVYDGNDGVHGNSGIDRRPIMANILENNGFNKRNSDFGGALNVSNNERDNYWESFKEELDDKIYDFLDEDLGKFGLMRR